MHEGFNLALPEKALLDTIYLRKSDPLSRRAGPHLPEQGKTGPAGG
jgi:hypothetical protein